MESQAAGRRDQQQSLRIECDWTPRVLTFLFPPRGGFLLALSNPIATSFNNGHICMVSETIQERGNASGIGKDLVPFSKGSICTYNYGSMFIAPVDDFVQQIRGMVVIGEIPDFVYAQKVRAGVGLELSSSEFRRIALEIFDQVGSRTKQDGIAGQHSAFPIRAAN